MINDNNNNRVSFQHMQFLVEAALNNLFTNDHEHHGWTFQDYSNAAVQYAMQNAVDNVDITTSTERFLN